MVKLENLSIVKTLGVGGFGRVELVSFWTELIIYAVRHLHLLSSSHRDDIGKDKLIYIMLIMPS